MRFKYDVLSEAVKEAKEKSTLEIQFYKPEDAELLSEFTNLRNLYIYFCEAQPEPISQMPNLKKLEIGMWCLNSINIDTCHNSSLEILAIYESVSPIEELSMDLTANTKLKELILSDLDLNQLPDGIDQLDQLIELELYGNKLEGLPPLPVSLEKLDIRDVLLHKMEWLRLKQRHQKCEILY